jgi:uncharacterized membrane protein
MMSGMQTARLWFARIVTAYALLLFAFLAYLYVVEPTDHIAKFGITASSAPESVNFLRAGPGALFAGMAVAAAIGLARPRRLTGALSVLVLFTGCVVAVRLYGMQAEGVTDVQLSELRNEGVSWLFFVAALFLHPRALKSDA